MDHRIILIRMVGNPRRQRRYCWSREREFDSPGSDKYNRLQSASRTAVSTDYPVEVRLRDTVILRDTVAVEDTLRRLHYVSPWLTLDGLISDTVFRGRIESRDTLVQVVHRVPRRFWFIRWGTKAVRQEVTSRNPFSRIMYTEYIELKGDDEFNNL